MSTLIVPTIDISDLPSNASTVDEIAQACEEWGFFQVTSHGIDPQLRQQFLTACQEFYDAPVQTLKKSLQRVIIGTIKQLGQGDGCPEIPEIPVPCGRVTDVN